MLNLNILMPLKPLGHVRIGRRKKWKNSIRIKHAIICLMSLQKWKCVDIS